MTCFIYLFDGLLFPVDEVLLESDDEIINKNFIIGVDVLCSALFTFCCRYFY